MIHELVMIRDGPSLGARAIARKDGKERLRRVFGEDCGEVIEAVEETFDGFLKLPNEETTRGDCFHFDPPGGLVCQGRNASGLVSWSLAAGLPRKVGFGTVRSSHRDVFKSLQAFFFSILGS